MTIYIAPNVKQALGPGIFHYTLVYKSVSGRMGFECRDSEGARAINSLNLNDAIYLSYGEGEIKNCTELDLLNELRRDLKLGAFLFFYPDKELEQEVVMLEEYNKLVRKNKLLERLKKEGVGKIDVPLLKGFYHNDVLLPVVEDLLVHCRCFMQSHFGDYGMYFSVFSGGEIDFSKILNSQYEVLSDSNDIPCW